MRRFHISTTARSTVSTPISGGSGCISSKYRQIATDSAMQVPSSSSNTGSPPYGLRFSASGERFAPWNKSTCSSGTVTPFFGQEDANAARIGRAGEVVEFHGLAPVRGFGIVEGPGAVDLVLRHAEYGRVPALHNGSFGPEPADAAGREQAAGVGRTS